MWLKPEDKYREDNQEATVPSPFDLYVNVNPY